MDTQKRTVRVRSAAAPVQGEVGDSFTAIDDWLKGTSPAEIENAGFGFTNGAAVIELVTGALEGNAARLAQVWGGPAAVETHKAIRMLHTTGTELAAVMKEVGTVLRTYGGVNLPAARQEMEGLRTKRAKALQVGPQPPEADGTVDARNLLKKLNGQIVELYAKIPEEFTYTLPAAAEPAGTGGYTTTDYSSVGRPTGSRGNGSTSRTDTGPWRGSGSPADGPYGTGGTNGGHSGTGGPDGTDDGSQGAGTPGHPGGTGGTDGSGTTGPGSGTGGQGSPGEPGPTGPGGQTAGPGSGGDGTAPAVIGGHETTSDGTGATHGSGRTEVASFAPTNLVAPPTIQQHTVLPVSPVTTSGPPLAPTVIGGPGFGGPGLGTGGAGAVPGASSPASRGGSPMMPFMSPGGGAGGGAEEQGQERTTWLSEDQDVWNSRGDVIPPVIT
ncbi:WXG100 family type VII secretion target [Streptosporangium jomthongense]|uniref:WXG100 family type VII secretion target n=1 Tax=Streptosporangium jomthongense TaxID=1193683 RepID=A0ABV8EV59_9ACTN